MSQKPYRFISFSYRVICFLLIISPTLGISWLAWDWSQSMILQSANRELTHAARCILDVVRMRYDLVHNYLYQDEQYLRENLSSTGSILHRLARELELEVARNHISKSRAHDLFISLVKDLNQQSDHEIIILNEDDRVLLHNMLPDRFNMKQYRWIQQMRSEGSGVLRYNWQYPGESDPVERLAAFRLLEGWGWLISLEVELPEPDDSNFGDQQLQGLNDFITGYHAPASGFAMILSNAEQSVISHPEFSDGALDQIPGAEQILATRSGVVSYTDAHGVRWRAGMVDFIPRQWVVAVTAREDQILKDSRSFLFLLLGICSVSVLIISMIFFRMMRSLVFAALSDTRKQGLSIK